MTVQTAYTPARGTGDGVITEFDFGFKYFNSSEVKVLADGEIVNSDDYTVTAAASTDGGTVTFDTAPEEDVEILIYLDLPYTQETRVKTVDRLERGAFEGMVDKVAMLAQLLKETIGRCIQFPINTDLEDFSTELPSTITARRAIVVNADATGFELTVSDPDEVAAEAAASATAAAASAAASGTSAAASAASAAAAVVSQLAAAVSAAAAAVSAAAAAASATSIGLTTKGDILAHTGAAYARKDVGANYSMLISDSAETDGLKWSPRILNIIIALTDGANIAVDASLGNIFSVTLADNRTMVNPTNPPAAGFSQKIEFWVKQDGTGSRTITWDTKYRFSGDVPSPTLTTTASRMDRVAFEYHPTDDKWDCIAVNRNYT